MTSFRSSRTGAFVQLFSICYRNQRLLFPFLLVMFFTSRVVLAQGPNGYTYCAPENGTFTLPAKSHVAYGADNKFKYLFNQTGTITFDNATFGGDPIFGTYKSGYYKLANGQESTATLSTAILKLKDHLTGVRDGYRYRPGRVL